MASSACAAAFNLPMLAGNQCGIPIHTSARASTPAATARSTYRSESSNSTPQVGMHEFRNLLKEDYRATAKPAGFESALRIGDRVLRGDASRRRPSSQKLLTQFLVIGADDFLRLVTLWRFPVAEKFGDYSKRCVRNSAPRR